VCVDANNDVKQNSYKYNRLLFKAISLSGIPTSEQMLRSTFPAKGGDLVVQFQFEVKRKRRESLCRHGSTAAITCLAKVSGFEIQFTDFSALAVIRTIR